MVAPHTASPWRLVALFGGLLALVLSVMAIPLPEPSPAETAQSAVAADPTVAAARHPAPPATDPRVQIATTSRLEVRVCSIAGEPLAGSRVLFYREETVGFPDDLCGMTDADGVFASEELPSGSYRVRIERHGFDRGTVREVELPAPQGTILSFALTPVRAPGHAAAGAD